MNDFLRTGLALACVLAVSACGSGDGDAPTGTTASTAGAESPIDKAIAVSGAADAGGNAVTGASTDLLPPGRYVLVNANSGKCVDVAGASGSDGANIQQADCNTNLAQVFDVLRPEGQGHLLRNAGSGKALDVAAASKADGANVQQWNDNGTNAQRFRITRVLGNRFVLTNVNSGKCVDVAGGSLADGANIQQATCNGTAAQQFHAHPHGASGRGVLPVGQYTVSSHHSRLCVGLAGGANAPAGAAVVQAACDGSTAQRFDVLAESGGTYRFSHALSHLSFDVANVATANGVPLVQWHDTAGLNQRFAVKATGSGYQIVAQHSGRCLDLRDWSKTAGGALQQWDCGDQANQRWAFEPAGTATPPPPPAGGWSLVWRDEFDGSAIDAAKWSFEVNGAGGGNNELQYYTARPENAFVSNGRLTIQALRERYCSTDGCRDFTSARLRTLNKGDWLYGRMEVRARLPRGQGLWPAIWMLPSDYAYGGWAASGEIDIMEAVNTGGSGGNVVHGTLHYGGAWPNNTYKGGQTTPATSVADNFHDYAVEWEPNQIRFYVDGVLYHTATEWWSSGGAFPAPFNKRFHMILNVAVGGNWPGSPNAGTVFPQRMEIDHVRVYQRATP